MKGWVGSHPDFQPCDVAPVARRGWFKSLMQGLKYDEYIPNSYSDSDGRIYDFLWNPAPRRTLAPPGSLLEHRLIEVEKRRDLAFREYHYLAGNLFRWYKLYGRAPSVGSWVWSWFPNGAEWRTGVEKYQDRVVEEMTKQFTDEGVPH